MDRLSGKIAIVTGAASGIGASITEELAKAGVKVFGVDIFGEKVEKLKNKISDVKGEIIAMQCDVKNEDAILEIFKIVKNKFGKIDVLVNAAGIGRYGLISDGNANFFKEIFDVNVMGTIICTQEALKLMKESNIDDGHIIFINSIGGHYVPYVSPEMFNVYFASKHSITALVESLRQELVFLKSKIRVSSVSPGIVNTDFMANFLAGSGVNYEDVNNEELKEAPSLEPKDVADAVLYVLTTPPHVQIHEMIIKPVGEKW